MVHVNRPAGSGREPIEVFFGGEEGFFFFFVENLEFCWKARWLGGSERARKSRLPLHYDPRHELLNNC